MNTNEEFKKYSSNGMKYSRNQSLLQNELSKQDINHYLSQVDDLNSSNLLSRSFNTKPVFEFSENAKFSIYS